MALPERPGKHPAKSRGKVWPLLLRAAESLTDLNLEFSGSVPDVVSGLTERGFPACDCSFLQLCHRAAVMDQPGYLS